MVSRLPRGKPCSTFGPPTDDESLPSYKGRRLWRRLDGDAADSRAPALPARGLGLLALGCCARLVQQCAAGTQEASGLAAASVAISALWALPAGWFADVAGRCRALLACGALLALGGGLDALAALPWASPRLHLFCITLLVPAGAAGVTVSLANFGADQYDPADGDEAVEQEGFFSWLCLAANVGAAAGMAALAALGSVTILGLPQHYGRFASYVVGAACLLLSLAALSASRPQYREEAPQRRFGLGAAASVVLAAARGGVPQAAALCAGALLVLFGICSSVIAALADTTADAQARLAVLAGGAVALGALIAAWPCFRPSWLVASSMSDAYISCAEVRAFLRLLPVLFSAHLAFSILENSMRAWYQQQVCQMDLRMPLSPAGLHLASASLPLARCLGVVLAVPTALWLVNPRLERACGDHSAHAIKFGIGLALAAASVLTAARLEVHRRGAPRLELLSSCAPEGIRMSALNSSWMLLPYLLLAAGEVYAQPALLQLAYARAPPCMRAAAAAAALLAGAGASALGAAQAVLLGQYLPNDLNNGRLEYGYYSSLAAAAALYAAFAHALGCLERRSFESSF